MSDTASGARQLPLAHLSIRVPWHDNGWNGTVCRNPRDNIACLILKRTSENRDDDLEESVAGQRWDQLATDQLPACVAERGSFMSPFEFTRYVQHPYQDFSDKHRHYRRTPFRMPPYSAGCIPFHWMMSDIIEGDKSQPGLVDELGLELGYNKQREPELNFHTIWVQDHRNQRVMLDTFFSAIKRESSLCIFYAKRTPLIDDNRRVIVGIGRVSYVGEAAEYEYDNLSDGDLRGYIWDRVVQHSIRPGFQDGFLMPYHQLLEAAEQNPTINPEEYVAFAPESYWDSFSWGSEHVTHDGAIGALLACNKALEKIGDLIPGDWDSLRQWINNELGRLWTMRGPFPGLGSALTAFGIPRGNLVAHEIALMQELENVEWNEDPWPLVERALHEPSFLPDAAQYLSKTICEIWDDLKPDRRALLKLLSRFEVTSEQAIRYFQSTEREEAGIKVKDSELLSNPYLLFEMDRQRPDSIGVEVIDRGLFPDPIVRNKHPLPEPSVLDGELDKRRVRALVVHQLELAAINGHSLQPSNSVIQGIRDMDLNPACPVGPDAMNVVEKHFAPMVSVESMKDESSSYQLERLREVRDLIRRTVESRIKGRPHTSDQNWRALVDSELRGPSDPNQEEQARLEKTAALEVLYRSRISVLVGPAGTGKTTLLGALCKLSGIKNNVLLLAPTGKARVRMETEIGVKGAKTIAQFLYPDRYDGDTNVYHLAPGKKRSKPNTVIIDEASMLTEEQLAAIIDALESPERLILVGDPHQLPPIGTGRPFLDIARRLAPDKIESTFPKVGLGYAELTIRRRQVGANRLDLLLASWFSGYFPGAGADEIWYQLTPDTNSENLRLVQWQNESDFQEKLLSTLIEEMNLDAKDNAVAFEESLGGSFASGKWYATFDLGESIKKLESWQVLSPVRGQWFGVSAINRLFQQTFRRRMIEYSRQPITNRWVASPAGSDGIVYGDKVMNLRNSRKDAWPTETNALNYIANGEIGRVSGINKRKYLAVEFSSQPGFTYSFWGRDFSDEGSPNLELAYALTVHKTQGSEFGITFLVLPNPCRLLSRELLYTALTRQKNKLVILYQGEFQDLFQYTYDEKSELAGRLTNIFERPQPVIVSVENKNLYLEKGLIHVTRRGERVRSKSEVIIADTLFSKGIDYHYEQELASIDGTSHRLPDFTIVDDGSGRNIFWEHLGMLRDPEYRTRWERKLEWYHEQGIYEEAEGEGQAGILVITRDDERGGIDSAGIAQVVARVFGI